MLLTLNGGQTQGNALKREVKYESTLGSIINISRKWINILRSISSLITPAEEVEREINPLYFLLC